MNDKLCDLYITEECGVSNQKAFIWSENGDLIKFIPHVTDINYSEEQVKVGTKSEPPVILTIFPQNKIFKVNGEEATVKELLKELGYQIRSREKELNDFNDRIKKQNTSFANVIKEILNNTDKSNGELLSNIEKELPYVIREFNNKFSYCKECKTYTEYHEYEDEVYDHRSNDYVLKSYYVCEECGEF